MLQADKSKDILLKKNYEFSSDLVTIGVIKEPFGINGLVKVKLFCEDPKKIINNSNDYLVGKNLVSTKIKLKKKIDKNTWLIRFSFISSREKILNHKGDFIACNKDLLPILDINEYYYFDLIGLNIEIKRDGRKGFVKNMVNYGSGDLLEMKLDGIDQTYYIPFNEENVMEINLNNKKLIISPQKGLLPKN